MSSRDLAVTMGAAAERRVGKRLAQLQERNAHRALQLAADAADHRHYTGEVIATGAFDAHALAAFGDDMVDLIDGDPVRARLVSPIVNDVPRLIRTDFIDCFSR